jgi:hypothetical protein
MKTLKPLKTNDKRASIKLWKAQVHLSKIRAQLKMLESTLRRILAIAKANPIDLIRNRERLAWLAKKNLTPDLSIDMYLV